MDKTTADRDINELSSPFREKVKLFLAEVWDEVFVTEAYRSQERQDYLYSLWRTVAWKIVTWTRNSDHTKRTAIDIAFNWIELYPEEDYKWLKIATVAKKYGMEWGFDLWWIDKPHFRDNWEPLDIDPLDELDRLKVFNDYSEDWDTKKLIEIWLRRYDNKQD